LDRQINESVRQIQIQGASIKHIAAPIRVDSYIQKIAGSSISLFFPVECCPIYRKAEGTNKRRRRRRKRIRCKIIFFGAGKQSQNNPQASHALL
jgi:L-2-hydroxyglutarate oxidase LhgO